MLGANNLNEIVDAAVARGNIGAGTGNGDLLAANNLNDVADVATARANLGAGTGDGDMLGANNLSDVDDPVVARANLGLANFGVGDLLAANNLNDLDDIPTARTNLGLGTAATKDAGTLTGEVLLLDADNALPVAIVNSLNIPSIAGLLVANQNLADLTDAAAARVNLGVPATLANLDNVPAIGNAGQIIQVAVNGVDHEYIDQPAIPVNLSDLNDDLGVPNVLANLDNVPAIGAVGQIIRVAANGADHEYIDQVVVPANLSDFNNDLNLNIPTILADLTDVDARGNAGQMIVVSGDGSNHVYQDQPTIPTLLSDLADVADIGNPSQVLRVTPLGNGYYFSDFHHNEINLFEVRGEEGQTLIKQANNQMAFEDITTSLITDMPKPELFAAGYYLKVNPAGDAYVFGEPGDMFGNSNLSDVADPIQSRENIKADFYATGETLHIGGVDKANSLLGLTSGVDHEGIALPIIAARFDEEDCRRHVFFGSDQSAIQRFSPFFNQNTHFDENDGVIIGSPNKDRIQALFNITGANLSYHVVQNEHRIVSNIAYGSTYVSLGTGGGTHLLNALCSTSGRGRFIVRSGIRGTFMADKYATSIIPGVDNPITNIYGIIGRQILHSIDSDVPNSVFGFSIIAYLDIQNSRTVFLPKVGNVVTNSDVAAELTIIDFTGNVNPGVTITIQAFQGQLINGQASVIINNAYGNYTLIGCPRTENWYVKNKT